MKGKIKVGDFVRIANVDAESQHLNDPIRVFDAAHPLQTGEIGVQIKDVRKKPDWYEKVKGKHLAFYEECMQTGELKYTSPGSGLCQSARDGYIDKDLLRYFEPDTDQELSLDSENLSTGWWASGLERNDNEKYAAFTPLRQTIVLFMAAINGEL